MESVVELFNLFYMKIVKPYYEKTTIRYKQNKEKTHTTLEFDWKHGSMLATRLITSLPACKNLSQTIGTIENVSQPKHTLVLH